MWIEIFRSGEHTDSSGKSRSFSDSDLEKISNKYNESVSGDSSLEAPLVKGHPRSDEPAFGWVEKLSRKGKRLLAKLKDVSPELNSEIRKGMFKKVSMAIYPDNMLRHVGLLGAFPPAVKGLKNVEFNNSNDFIGFSEEFNENADNFSDIIEYSETIYSELISAKKKIDSLESELKDELFKNKREKYLEFAENIEINNSKILTPKYANELADILTNLSLNNQEYSDKLINIFENIQPFDLTSEIEFTENNNDSKFSGEIDSERLAIHTKALEMMNLDKSLNYEEAILKQFN